MYIVWRLVNNNGKHNESIIESWSNGRRQSCYGREWREFGSSKSGVDSPKAVLVGLLNWELWGDWARDILPLTNPPPPPVAVAAAGVLESPL